MLINQQLDERSIGAILMDTGKLTAINAEMIIREQKLHNLRFGDAAIKLGLLNHDDIQFQMIRVFYNYLHQGL